MPGNHRSAFALALALLLCACQNGPQEGGAPTPAPASDPAAPVSSTATGPNTCACHCLANWVAALAAPDVSDPGYPSTSFFGGTMTDQGLTYWSAKVTTKTYLCTTRAATGQTTSTANLAHNAYRDVQTRSFSFSSFSWGPWSAPVRTTGAVLADRDALASAAPPFTPWCPDAGLTCP